jgi:hypothetical protein
MAVTHALDLAELGRQKGAELLDAEEDTLPAVELFDPEFADGALAEFERARQDRFRGVVRKMMRGGHRYARRMHPEPTQGLVEINQNADDQGAREVRFAIERQRGNRYLLASHDGGRVRLDHIVGMVFPFVSGKLDDAEAFGQWGIGMKTIRRLGEPLWVHCAPFHFVLEQDGLHRCKPSPAMAGLYDPTHPDTLLRLQLSGDVGADVLTEWMDRRSSADLLFLKSVQRLVVVDGQSGKEVLAHGLRRGGGAPPHDAHRGDRQSPLGSVDGARPDRRGHRARGEGRRGDDPHRGRASGSSHRQPVLRRAAARRAI